MTAAVAAAAAATHRPPLSAVSSFISAANTKSPREALAFEILHNLRYQHRWTDLKVHSISNPSSAPCQSQDAPNDNNIRTQSPTRSTDHPPTPTYSRSKSPSSQHDGALFLISGLPPRNLYIHPDLQKRLVRDAIDESALQLQREWVLPMSIGEKWTLKRFCWVFDALPEREAVHIHVHVRGQGNPDETQRHEMDNVVVDDDDDKDVGAGAGAGAGAASMSVSTLTSGTARQMAGGIVAAEDVELTWHDRKRVLLAMLAHNGMGGDGTVAYYIMQEGDVKPRQNG